MNHLNIHIESYEVDGNPILQDINLIINADDRIAIVGKNGVGKSTFMKILTNEITGFHGKIENIGAISLGYLEQIHFMDESKSVYDDLRDAFVEIRTLERTIEQEEQTMAETGEYETYLEAIERLKLLGGYTYTHEVERVARGIGIFHLLDKRLSDVSGGERTKIALAKILLSKPDFLLLDEPTNFIDLHSVEWLEKYLQETWKGGYMIISHDREFLDATCNQVIEILGTHGMSIYHGNYTDAVEEKILKQERYEKIYEEQQTFLESEKKLIDRFRAGSRAGFAKSREKALGKVEILEKPDFGQEIAFHFEIGEKSTETVFQMEDVFIGRKDPLFYIRSVEIGRGERIGIVGENGVGKSTLIKTLLGNISALEGTLKRGKLNEILYYSQLHEELDTTKTIYENFEAHGFSMSREKIASIIGHYGFSYADLDTRTGSLSGGERSRILFSILGLKKGNLLILDEPTNHLDYDTREALEKALKHYEGSLLFISHDRYFVNKLAGKLWIIEDGELSVSYGNYDDYRYKKEHGIELDMSLFDASGEMDLVLQERLGKDEARRIKEKFARKKRRD